MARRHQWEWPDGGPALVPPDVHLRVWTCTPEQAAAEQVPLEEPESERLLWPCDLLTLPSLLVLPSQRHATQTALLRRLAALCAADPARWPRPVYATQHALLEALAAHPSDAATALRVAQGLAPDALDPPAPRGLLLLLDGWAGDVSPLRRFLARHAVHVAPTSERYATQHKAGIGAEESSADPPLPRFLGSARNDTFGALAPGTLALHGVLLACDPHCYRVNALHRYFTALRLCQPSPAACHALVHRMCSLDCPSARSAPDAWIAFVCGVAATQPPPLDPVAPRALLTSLSGALTHLTAHVPRATLLCAGLLSTVQLAHGQPLSADASLHVCELFLGNQRDAELAETPPATLLASVAHALRGLASPAHAPRLVLAHPLVAQWLAARWLAVEDALTERVTQAAARLYPVLKDVAGPISSQQLPFIYSPQCVADPAWREVLHFIGVHSGVYPLAYRLCAWGDNSNIAAYQWLLQLKSQSCSPMHHVRKTPPGARPVQPAGLFEYHTHGDVGREVFWVLCRVQAEISVANPALAQEHGEDNTFPHFVRATLANPRHAYDLCAALADPIMALALARLPDGRSIGSHLADLCAEAGIARPWAAPYYARLLSTLVDAGLLSAATPSLHCRALQTSKSTSKRLFAAAFLRAHGVRVALEEADTLLPLVLGVTDRSPFVRDECSAALTELLLALSPPLLRDAGLRQALQVALPALSDLAREATPHRLLGPTLACAAQLLAAQSPLAPLPLLLLASDETPNGTSEAAARLWSVVTRGLSGDAAAAAALSALHVAWGAALPAAHAELVLPLWARHAQLLRHALLAQADLEGRAHGDAGAVVGPLLCAQSEAGAAAVAARASGGDAAAVRWLCSPLVPPEHRSPSLLVAVAHATHPRHTASLLATAKSDLDQLPWYARATLTAQAQQQLLALLPDSPVGVTLDALALLLSCHRPLPAARALALLEAAAAAPLDSDAALHARLHVLATLQLFGNARLLDAPAPEGARLLAGLAALATAPPRSADAPVSLRLAVHASCVRLASLLGDAAVASCATVLGDAQCSPAALAYSAQVLRQVAREGVTPVVAAALAGVDAAALLGRVAGHTAAHTDVVALARELVACGAWPGAPLVRGAVSLAISSDETLCPLLREAALGLAVACVTHHPGGVEAREWVAWVMEEVARRAEHVRAEEPGCLAAMALLKQACRAADRTRPALEDVALAIAAHDAQLAAVLEGAAARRPDGGSSNGSGGGPSSAGWNISIVSQCLGALKHLLRLEVVTATASGGRLAQLVVALSCDPAMTSPELRRVVLRVMHAMPHPVLLQGLRLLAAGAKKSPRWTLFAKLRSSSDSRTSTPEPRELTPDDATTPASPAPTVGATASEDPAPDTLPPLVDLLAPVFKCYERSSLPKERLAMLELLALVAFGGSPGGGSSAPSQAVTKTEALVCDTLRNATAAVSNDLSALVARHTALFLPHVWTMLAASIRSRTVANKWLTFLRKHYQPDVDSLHVQQVMLVPPPLSEVAAALRGFAAVCSPANRLEASMVYRLLGVVYDVCVRAPAHPSLFAACVTVSQGAVAALTDASSAQAASEHKETALLLTVHLLGRWAAASAPPNTQWYEHLRPVLDGLPYGLGRHAWRQLQAATGTLLF